MVMNFSYPRPRLRAAIHGVAAPLKRHESHRLGGGAGWRAI